MNIYYSERGDLLYLRLDDREQPVENRRINADIVLDVGEGEKIVGIEILDASRHVSLDRLLPPKYELT